MNNLVLFQLDNDEALERRIDGAYRNMLAATTREDQVKHMRKMYALIVRRSPRQVAKMERQRGLEDAGS